MVALGLLVLLVLLVLPALPASGRSISPANLNALTNSINHGRTLTYDAQYTSVSNGQKSTITIAQAPPKSIFTSSGSSVVDNGKTTYYCSANTGSTSNSGNSGNSGSTTTATSHPTEQCLAEKGVNPLVGLEDIFSPAVALGALAEAREGLVSKLLGIKVSSSTATFAGQPSTCVTLNVRGKGARYCVTKQGILSYSGSSSDYFELTTFTSKPPASLFTLPAGATTATLPAGGANP